MSSSSKLSAAPFTTVPFELDQIPVGSLVPNLIEPDVDIWSPPPNLDHKTLSVRRNPHNDFRSAFGRGSKSDILANLTKYFKATCEISKSADLNINAESGFEYKFLQPQDAFNTICALPSTRQWIQREMEKPAHKISFITGYRTFVNAEIRVGTTRQLNTNVEGEVPVGMSAGIPKVGDTLDAKLAAGRESHALANEAMKVPGERIFLLYYREVKFHFWRPSAENPLLASDTRWLEITGKENRSDGKSEDDVECIEADIVDKEPVWEREGF
ncbi:hypothetical protein EJ02DRAFT_458028 [Clathrospora elynae]|uniref:Uncharacterized protein n=1 Tax=Clathrospora elynae TaxID=706981 RepID=A0A6A5SCC7_9PLEO|nr:hypothetical protein EJ02DRAFT_458028 [Clathrospora elynae]